MLEIPGTCLEEGGEGGERKRGRYTIGRFKETILLKHNSHTINSFIQVYQSMVFSILTNVNILNIIIINFRILSPSQEGTS